MPGFVVTRGLGPGATPSNLIVRGFNPIAAAAIELARGAVRRGRRAKEQLAEVLQELKVTVALVAINGKDLVKPIINTMRTSYKDEPAPEVRVTPTKLSVRQPEINVKVIKVRKTNVND